MQHIYLYDVQTLKNGILQPLTLSHWATQSTLGLAKKNCAFMVVAHCTGSLRSPTVINSNVSRWDTGENANKNVSVCEKEREMCLYLYVQQRWSSLSCDDGFVLRSRLLNPDTVCSDKQLD